MQIGDILTQIFENGDKKEIEKPSDLYITDEDHLFNLCRKFIKDKNIIQDLRVIENVLKNQNKVIFDFTMENIDIVNSKSLRYPVDCYTYNIREAHDVQELIEAFKSIEIILKDYKQMFSMDTETIRNTVKYKVYIDYKKIENHSKSNNKVFINEALKFELESYNEVAKEELVKIIDKCGIYKLYDENEILIFIGKSNNLAKRILASIREKKAFYFSYSLINNEIDSEIYKIYYISKLKPVLNAESSTKETTTIKLDNIEFSEPTYIF